MRTARSWLKRAREALERQCKLPVTRLLWITVVLCLLLLCWTLRFNVHSSRILKNLRLQWKQRHLLKQRHWDRLEPLKAQLPRAEFGPEGPIGVALPAWVVSLDRAGDRRSWMEWQLREQNVTYELVPAVDGLGELPDQEVEYYLSRKRRAKLGDRNVRREAGCALSHLRLMHRMIGEGRPAALILEDDAQLDTKEGPFLEMLDAAMRELPEDWEVLFLNACWLKAGGKGVIGPHVRMYKDGVCTIGYVATPNFAFKVLDFAKQSNMAIDLLQRKLINMGKIQAYLADPTLVKWGSFSSTIRSRRRFAMELLG